MQGSSKARARRRIVTALAVSVVVAGFYAVLYSPPVYQWGSSAQERVAPMAGDDIVTNPSMVATRSVTIAAPASEVWPWLVQMGVDRAGFYTFDWAERLFGDPMHNADTIAPQWQDLAVGDFVHPFPPERGLPSWRVRELVPQRALVLATDDSSWSWATELRPSSDSHTRLVTRMRGQRTALSVVLDPADLIVFPRVLVGLKQRAEGSLPGMPGTFIAGPLPTARLPVRSWAAIAWIVVTALVGRLLKLGSWRERRRHPGTTLAIGIVAGAGYMIMSDTPPGAFLTTRPAVGFVGAVAAATAGWWLLRRGDTVRASTACRGGRAVVAVAEAGLLVVLPVTAVWQTAAALGWTEQVPAHVLVGAVAVGCAVAVSGIAAADWQPGRRHRLALPLLVATGLVTTGAGLMPLLGAALLELLPSSQPAGMDHTTPGTDEREPSVPAPVG
jgi:hypothetical protein